MRVHALPAAAHSKPSNRMLDAATVPVAAWRCLLWKGSDKRRDATGGVTWNSRPNASLCSCGS
nr:MAG TPA: hypothetical protein [Caudoviricetes sp.]